MIAKGNLHGDGAKLALYLTTGKDGERAELIELRGFPTDNIRDAFVAAQLGAEAKTQATRPFFHAHVRLPEGESLDRDQWLYVADRIEHQLGFDGQPRALALHHQPDGETHLHIAWSRHDLEHDRAIDPGLYRNKLKEVSRELEKELGLTRVRNERDPEQKTLAPGRNEFEQARRLGTDLKAIREGIRDCWDRSDNGKAFEAALAERGYILARGDQRDFVVIDPAGGDHALGKRITGAPAAETRARLADIDKGHLPSVEQAQAMQAERAHLAALRDIPRTVPGLGDGIPLPQPARGAGPETRAAERPAATVEPPQRTEATPEPGGEKLARARDHSGTRDAGDIAGRLTGGLLKGAGKFFEAIANLFAPPPPPTPEQQKRDAAEEQERETRAREVADRDARFRAIMEQQRDARRRRMEELRREPPGRDRDMENDHDHSRGRERER